MEPEPLAEVRIESLAGSGDGVAHDAEGRTLFVPFTVPGDRVRVLVVEVHKRFARGRLVEILEPGPGRVEPRCPVFGACGGCTWQHVAYETQLRAKARILHDALVRIGGLAPPEEIVVRPCPEPYGYRARTRVRVEGGRVGYTRRRSHALCPVQGCPLLVPELDRALGALAVRPPAEAGAWELTAGDGGIVRASPLASRGGARRRVAVEVAGERIELSPGSFVQANAPLRQELAAAVLDAAGAGQALLELFAGAGFFTIPLARRWRRVVAVEAHAGAARDLRRNAESAGLEHVRVVNLSVEQALRGPSARGARASVVVLDPPRTGLPRECAEALAALAPERIVYVSCDPATLARDLAALVRTGFTLGRVRGFDLFPQTPHVEALAVLER